VGVQLSGKTWLNHDAHGTEFFNAKGFQVVDVQGGQKITKVGVQLGLLPYGSWEFLLVLHPNVKLRF